MWCHSISFYRQRWVRDWNHVIDTIMLHNAEIMHAQIERLCIINMPKLSEKLTTLELQTKYQQTPNHPRIRLQ